MADGGWINPLSSFQEMGTLPKILLLLGFVFLVTALLHGASFSDRMLPVSFAFISLSLTVHYFSECRKTVMDGQFSVKVTDKGKVASGIVMSVVTVALAIWTAFIPTQKPKAVMVASPEVSKTADVPATQNDSKINAATDAGVPPRKSKSPTGKNQTSRDDTQVAGDNGAVVGPVTQGPCSVLQAGGTQNQATGGNCGAPERHLTESQADALAIAAALIPESQKVSIETCNTPECQRYARTFTMP